MFCKFCGNEIDSSFCPNCGAKQTENKAEDEIILENDTNENSETSKRTKVLPEKNIKILQKCCFFGVIAGITGLAIFLGIVLVGLIAYKKVYLFDGYNFTKVLSVISIIFMMIGLCSAIIKCILHFIFKIGTFPNTIVKRIMLAFLAVACLGCSIWGFADCSNSSNNDSGYGASGGSSSGNYNTTVSEYLGLSFSVTSIKTSGSYTYVYCSVKNVSSSYGNPTKYRYIKVKAVFKDRSGSILDTDWTYAIDSAWLEPGETKTFYYMVRNTSVKSATLYIME